MPKAKSSVDKDYELFRRHIKVEESLRVLLSEKGVAFADCKIRFSSRGQAYALHSDILGLSFDHIFTDAEWKNLARHAPLDPLLEEFVLGRLYFDKLPEPLPLNLLDALKLVAWALEWECPGIERFAKDLAHLLMRRCTPSHLAKTMHAALDSSLKGAVPLFLEHMDEYKVPSKGFETLMPRTAPFVSEWEESRYRWRCRSHDATKRDGSKDFYRQILLKDRGTNTTVFYGERAVFYIHASIATVRWPYFEKHRVSAGRQRFELKLENLGPAEVGFEVARQLCFQCYDTNNNQISPAAALVYILKSHSFDVPITSFHSSVCFGKIRSNMTLDSMRTVLIVADELGLFDDNLDASKFGPIPWFAKLHERVREIGRIVLNNPLPKPLLDKIKNSCFAEGANAPTAPPLPHVDTVFFVRTLTGKTFPLQNRTLHDTLPELKAAIQDKEGIPPDQSRLVFAGQQFPEHFTAGEFGLHHESTMHLILRLRGG